MIFRVLPWIKYTLTLAFISGVLTGKAWGKNASDPHWYTSQLKMQGLPLENARMLEMNSQHLETHLHHRRRALGALEERIGAEEQTLRLIQTVLDHGVRAAVYPPFPQNVLDALKEMPHRLTPLAGALNHHGSLAAQDAQRIQGALGDPCHKDFWARAFQDLQTMQSQVVWLQHRLERLREEIYWTAHTLHGSYVLPRETLVPSPLGRQGLWGPKQMAPVNH